MNSRLKIKIFLLLLGDIVALYASLWLTLLIRYRIVPDTPAFLEIASPFSFIFFLWILIFYINGLYDLPSLKNNLRFVGRIFGALLSSAILSIILFYFVPFFGITPKTTLFIFLGIFGIVGYLWRAMVNDAFSVGAPSTRILLVGTAPTAEELAGKIGSNPQLGYEVRFWMKEGLEDKEFSHLAQIILAESINLIVVPAHIKKNSRAARVMYQTLALGIEVVDLAELYEVLFKKIPLAELEEVWFLENIAKRHRTYELLKRPLEMILSLALSILFFLFAIVIGLYILFADGLPIIYAQKRVGQFGRVFTLYKFRTLRRDAEASGPQWAAHKGDRRALPLGNLLRKSHLDEAPQLWNIFRGDLSLVGPRPERPEFTERLKTEIPYYDLRHLIRPGITGWAQINYRYGASVEDAYQKLQYDIYYLKNRSLILDILIVLKTIKLFFANIS